MIHERNGRAAKEKRAPAGGGVSGRPRGGQPGAAGSEYAGTTDREHAGAALRVENLTTCFGTSSGFVTILDGIDFTLEPHRVHGILGESGCGKTVTNLSIMRLLPANGRITDGRIIYGGRDILPVSEAEMRRLRGGSIALIFQEPSASFNPYLKISTQMIETIRLHRGLSRRDARAMAVELLEFIGVAGSERRIDDYPHQFSGGMLQRVLVTIAAACEADVILADEPTSDLDLTSQDKVLALLKTVCDQKGVSILLVTHDLGVAARMCDTVSVMYAGRLVESAPVLEFFKDPKHPYSQDLLRAAPDFTKQWDDSHAIPGNPPDFGNLPPGCVYHPRCRFATTACRQKSPPQVMLANRSVGCRLYSLS